MSQQQYNDLMSSMLKQKCSLTKLREELERRKGKLCFSCKKFGHLAQNCRNKKVEEKRKMTPHNKFEVLVSRVIRYGIEVRRQEMYEEERRIVECFKYRRKRHKCRECPK